MDSVVPEVKYAHNNRLSEFDTCKYPQSKGASWPSNVWDPLKAKPDSVHRAAYSPKRRLDALKLSSISLIENGRTRSGICANLEQRKEQYGRVRLPWVAETSRLIPDTRG